MDKGRTRLFKPTRHRDLVEQNLVNCDCVECRRKAKLQSGEERIAVERSKENFRLRDVPLFCCVFPEGVEGSCGFFFHGYCEAFEVSCVRWNEVGDRKDYGFGFPNPFLGGE